MASEEYQRTQQRSRDLLDWNNASNPAKKWWEQLEALNEDRVDLVIKLTDQLLVRDATIDDFFLVCSYSGREGVQENLSYLDMIRQDKEENMLGDMEIKENLENVGVRNPRYYH